MSRSGSGCAQVDDGAARAISDSCAAATKTARIAPGRWVLRWRSWLDRLAASAGAYAANGAFIFFSAFASTWRMRSAETPYSSASSCRVILLSASSQRRLMMSRERASNLAPALAQQRELVVVAVGAR
jgi:hypothetical protein